MAFARTGERAVMEAPYFLRRRKLIAALLGALMDGEGVDAVADGLWLICEETSWVISAHNGGEHDGVEARAYAPLPDPNRPYVDLFAAQTAMILSLACQLLGEELDEVSPLIRRRVRREIERRVLVPFETRDDFWWMGVIRRDLCNWTPWIVSNVMLTACVWVDDRLRLAALLERGCAMLDRYLDVLPEDGGCDEGAGYWSMAGGALLDCLELLERVTAGGWPSGRTEKLRSMLRFPLERLAGRGLVCQLRRLRRPPGRPRRAPAIRGEAAGRPGARRLGGAFPRRSDGLKDTPQLWRLLNGLFHPAEGRVAESTPPGDVWLPDLQIRRLTRDGATLVCKGGVNEGSHNHNDCGSFMLFVDGEPQIVDAGNMTYTGKTFSEQRYTLWNTRSMYHNVPLIGGVRAGRGGSAGRGTWRARRTACRWTSPGPIPRGGGLLTCGRRLAADDGGADPRRDRGTESPDRDRGVPAAPPGPNQAAACDPAGSASSRPP